MKSILLLGAGEMQVPIIKKAKAMGLRVIVADYNPDAPGFQYADISSQISTNDEKGIYNLALKEKVDGICTTSDFPVRTVAYVCEKLNLNGLSVESAGIVTNKYFQREILQKCNLPIPNFVKLDVIGDIEKCKKLEYPVIIKPVDSSASRGVTKVRDFKELESAFYEAQKYSNSGMVIVEEYIGGREFSVEVLIQNEIANVIAITEKFTDGFNECYFVEEKHIIPARISSEERNNIIQTVKSALTGIKLNNSSAHVELKIFNSKIYIIEIAGRLGGDYITSDLVPLATGVDMLSNVINISLGIDIDLEQNYYRYSGIRFLTANNYDTTIKDLSSMDLEPFLVRKEIHVDKEIHELRSSLDRLGYYIFCTDTQEKLKSLMCI